MRKPHIAASIYLNAAPLCYSFRFGKQRDRCAFMPDVAPARCSELLAEARADAALIPVIEYQRIPGLKIAGRVCVASQSNVRSVVLASRVPIEQVRSVALDTSSRTSAALIRIILGQFYGLEPTYTVSEPKIDQMLSSSDAALIIGDPAMLIDRSRLHVYDLAREWRKQTDLPFVFAFWAVRDDSEAWAATARTSREIDFLSAKQEGLEHIGELAALYSEQLGLSSDDVTSYLTQNISYDLDDTSLQALGLYFKLAGETGLIEKPRPLEFLE